MKIVKYGKKPSIFKSKVRGIVSFEDGEPVILPVSRGDNRKYYLKGKIPSKIENGNLVECLITRLRLRHVKVIKILATNIFGYDLNYLTLSEKSIPTSFPKEVLKEIDEIVAPSKFDHHKDFTHLPFITVDPEDAKDHDDAICAIAQSASLNGAKFKVYVAIADVSYFFSENSQIDLEARARGNSTYLPSLCIPMLPKKLSFDLCSLVENKLRPCIVAEIGIGEKGKKKYHKFHRAVVKNKKALSYNDLEAVRIKDSKNCSGLDQSIKILWDLYDLLMVEKIQRSPIELEFPELLIKKDADDNVTEVSNSISRPSNHLIEELMILANICAAETIQKEGKEMVFRVHPPPKKDTIPDYTQERRQLSSIRSNNFTPKYLNELIKSARTNDEKFLARQGVIKVLERAYYRTSNIGHFGLNLNSYTHFTSPIRRYADLMIHRLLVESIVEGEQKNSTLDKIELQEICTHISLTERRSSEAESIGKKRYIAKYMKGKLGEKFEGTVVNFSRKVVFIRINYLNIEGALMINQGRNNHIFFDRRYGNFVTRHTSKMLDVGTKISVKLIDTNELNGSLTFESTD